MKINIEDQQFEVKFRYVHRPAEAKVDAIRYGVKPKLALNRIVAETICILTYQGQKVVEGRAFQSKLERHGFIHEKGEKVALREALERLGIPREKRKGVWEQFLAA